MSKPIEFMKNLLSYREVRKVLSDYKDKIRWRDDGLDKWLDIGCGTGVITYEQIIPMLPLTFKQITACDTSSENIEYAKANYHHPKLRFTVFDIEIAGSSVYDDEESDVSNDSGINKCGLLGGKFDHISAFFVLNCVQMPLLSLDHMFRLLKAKGDCLLVTFGQLPLYDAYLKLSETDKWKKYMEDVSEFISVYHNRPEKFDEFEMVLMTSGFTDHVIEIRDGVYTIDGIENARKIFESVNPMLYRVPEELKLEFTDDIIKCMLTCDRVEKADFFDPNFKLTYTYTVIVAYGRTV